MRFSGRGNNGTSPKKGKASPAGGSPVLFPGPEGWEMWSGPADQPVCVGPVQQPRQLRPSAGCIMSLPARAFFSVPLWVPVVEESPSREQTQMKLEMKGMLGANPDSAIWNFESIRQEKSSASADGEPILRQLESVAVLAAPFRPEWLVEPATRYEPAGRMLVPPGTGPVGALRRELGRWVADFYQGGKWLHSQTLLSPSLDGSAAVELAATFAQLESEGILLRVEAWLVRERGAAVDEEFRRRLEVPLRLEERAVPRPPREVWNLPPPALTELRSERARHAQKKKKIRIFALVYLLAGLLGITYLGWPLVRLQMARAELGKIGAEAASIRDTSLLWKEAGAWLDPRRNALELLWQVSRPLIETEPARIEGVRLTLFDLNPKRLLLQGEGKDLELVEKYFQWLRNEPTLAGFTWKNPQPRLLPNGNAQFQAEGIPPGVAGEEKEGGENEGSDTP